jgi:hypothetical protein
LSSDRSGDRLSGPAFVEAQLNGLFRPDFVADGPVTGRLGDPFEGALGLEAARPTRIHDARQLQARDGEAEARFFEDHGFVLLPPESAVEDWEV